MKKIITSIFAASFLLAGLSTVSPAEAQTTTTSTTLAAAMANNDKTISLSSSTGVSAAGQSPTTGIYIDREYMTILSNANAAGTGNVWNVRRGAARQRIGRLGGRPFERSFRPGTL